MADFMNEIEDDLRQQRLKAFWLENRAWIIGGAIMAVVMTAGLTFWREYTFNRDVSATMNLTVAAKNSDPKELMTFSAMAKGEHAAFAKMEAAGLFLKSGDRKAAIAAFDEVAGMRGVDRDLRDLAKLYSILQRIDDGDAEKLMAEIEPLAGEKSTWRFSAMEAKALLLARMGRYQEAVDVLTLISGNAETPGNLRSRALTLRDVYAGQILAK